MEIEIGKRVLASTGKHIGNIDYIVIDRDRKRLRLFVVREGLVLTKDRMIEPTHVSTIDSDGTIRLNIDENQVNQLPEFIHARFKPYLREDGWMRAITMGAEGGIFIAPAGFAYQSLTGGDVSNIPPKAVLLDHDSRVYDRDGNLIGSIEDVTYNTDGSLVSVEVRTGLIEHHTYTVPKSDIASASRWRVVLRVSKGEVERR